MVPLKDGYFILLKKHVLFDSLCNKNFWGFYGTKFHQLASDGDQCPTNMNLSKFIQKKLLLSRSGYYCSKLFVWLHQDFPKPATFRKTEKKKRKKNFGNHVREAIVRDHVISIVRDHVRDR